jgi:hypothetical protein
MYQKIDQTLRHTFQTCLPKVHHTKANCALFYPNSNQKQSHHHLGKDTKIHIQNKDNPMQQIDMPVQSDDENLHICNHPMTSVPWPNGIMRRDQVEEKLQWKLLQMLCDSMVVGEVALVFAAVEYHLMDGKCVAIVRWSILHFRNLNV